MTRIHNNEVNNISECNLLYNIINPPKHAKKLNTHCSPIIHGYMNTREGKAEFKNFPVLLDSGCSYMIVIGRVVTKIFPEKDSPMQWHTQAGNSSTNLKVKVYFTLPALSVKNVLK